MADHTIEILATKIVEGGQALGVLPDGKKVFVWNALPGEIVKARIIKQKHSFAEAIAEKITLPSPERIVPQEANYLATSPWQIMTFAAENTYKHQVVQNIFDQAKVPIPAFHLTTGGDTYHYRNKMEYSFWGDDSGLHLAMFRRGSHGKQIVAGSVLARRAVDSAANSVLVQLQKLQIRAGDLKTIIVRSSQRDAVVAALYVKPESFPKFALPEGLQGIRVYHSNPKSPASVRTKLLQEEGGLTVQDTLLGREFTYDVDAFFQVNLPVYELALRRIKEHCSAAELTDMYAGVGSIGLSVASKGADLVELDPATAAMARLNAERSGLKAHVVEVSTDKALEYITPKRLVIFDPPRAGLHEKVVDAVLSVRPPEVVYLSCNPTTQARDLVRLHDSYAIEYLEAFNFFPRTPHIETLAILRRK